MKPPQRFGWDEDEVHFALITRGGPTTFQEAMKNSEREGWMGATMDEMVSPQKNSVWELVSKPKDKKPVGYKWEFRKKEVLQENEKPKFKTHLLAKVQGTSISKRLLTERRGLL